MSCTESRKLVNTMTRDVASLVAKCLRKICVRRASLGEWCAPFPAIDRIISIASLYVVLSRIRCAIWGLLATPAA